jgi:hypothetical protein
MDKFQITKPLDRLPPLRIKTFRIETATKIDFIRQHNAICVNLSVHNHGNQNETYRLNETDAILDLESSVGQEEFRGVHIYNFEVFDTPVLVEVVAVIADLPLLKLHGALSNA